MDVVAENVAEATTAAAGRGGTGGCPAKKTGTSCPPRIQTIASGPQPSEAARATPALALVRPVLHENAGIFWRVRKFLEDLESLEITMQQGTRRGTAC